MPDAGGAVATARIRIRPEFLDGFARGRRFGLWVEPPDGVESRGAILCVQPFGDEATLARRVLAAQARRLASVGWATLILDLYGTGDSDGETSDATLALWRDDLLRACRLARERAPGRLLAWGTRMGALLAAQLLREAAELDALILWQPPAGGASLIDPLRRLAGVGALARERSAGGGAGGDPRDASAGAAPAATQSIAGAPSAIVPLSPADVADTRTAPQVLLAGYLLRDDLVDGLAALDPGPPAAGAQRSPCPLLVLAVQRVLTAGAPPKALADLARRWTDAGHPATMRAVQGEPFWASLEPSTPLAAFEATAAFVDEAFPR